MKFSKSILEKRIRVGEFYKLTSPKGDVYKGRLITTITFGLVFEIEKLKTHLPLFSTINLNWKIEQYK